MQLPQQHGRIQGALGPRNGTVRRCRFGDKSVKNNLW